MRKLFFVLGVMGALTASLYAAPVGCGTNGDTWAEYKGGNYAEGCLQSDKLYSNFVDLTLPVGVQAIPGSWFVVMQEAILDQHSITFTTPPEGGIVAGPGTWGVGYTLQVTDLTKSITKVFVDFTSAGAPTSAVTKKIYNISGDLIAIAGQSVAGTVIPASQWIRVEETITLANTNLTSFQDVYVQTVGTVPEPGTYAMMGLGLAALGLISRRKKKV